ncbi:hypothetical protein [Limnochorda pilosa]|uniref:Uncharacterized protein n=1 Tax=Limnochorda pilosa TaxID=1555112 RepID=A0A0K2SN69_LIMPI|nr:hypothetical protein [Limnochorda pilosa]BAS28578.1 hypothetical protein LIP_2748 [Limnochorda pilosa]
MTMTRTSWAARPLEYYYRAIEQPRLPWQIVTLTGILQGTAGVLASRHLTFAGPLPSWLSYVFGVGGGVLGVLFSWLVGGFVVSLFTEVETNSFVIWGNTFLIAAVWSAATLVPVWILAPEIPVAPDALGSPEEYVALLEASQRLIEQSGARRLLVWGGRGVQLLQIGLCHAGLLRRRESRALPASIALLGVFLAFAMVPSLLKHGLQRFLGI